MAARKSNQGKLQNDKIFGAFKKGVIGALESELVDKSRKGNLDAPIADLVQLLNAADDYVTTSSCSGRICLFQQIKKPADSSTKAAGGGWLLIEHSLVDLSQVLQALSSHGFSSPLFSLPSSTTTDTTATFSNTSSSPSSSSDSTDTIPIEGSKDSLSNAVHNNSMTWLRHEPFILHIACRSAEAGQKLYQIARDAGYRESGLSLGRRKIMLAIRTTSLSLAAPIAIDDQILCSKEHLAVLVQECCQLFEQNSRMISKFESLLRQFLSSPQ